MAALALTAALLLPGDPRPPVVWQMPLEHWDATYTLRIDKTAPTPKLVVELPTANSALTSTSLALGVEQWRNLVATYFPADQVDRALRVLGCETGWTGNPSSKNPTSSAAGLFQFLRSTWDRVAVPLGYGSYDSGAVYDPVANVHAASVLSQGGSDWSQWSCKP